MIKEAGEGGEGQSPPGTESIRLMAEGRRHGGVAKMNRLHLQTWIRKKNYGDYPKLRRLKLKRPSGFQKRTKAAVTQRDRGDTMKDGVKKGRSVNPLIDQSRLTINMKGQSGHSGHTKVLSKNLFQHKM